MNAKRTALIRYRLEQAKTAVERAEAFLAEIGRTLGGPADAVGGLGE